ncbi:MAG: hypothetical protein HRT83_02490 [Hyphomicrobiaceae bacterium]|nr:hypothetical protein [Hyphomicrobiaceae bacterium]
MSHVDIKSGHLKSFPALDYTSKNRLQLCTGLVGRERIYNSTAIRKRRNPFAMRIQCYLL